MNKSSQKLHFSIGPVQGFVGRSRRTRDLWASSFLLSYLAGKAIVELRQNFDADMVLPDVDGNRLISFLEGDRSGEEPRHGTVPNRFVVNVDSPTDAADAAKVAIDNAWKEVAEAVWEEYLEPVAHHGDKTREIWERQVSYFWQISWAVGDDPSTLDRRKNWRSHAPPVEYGDKCTMMHRHQELSGYVRAQRSSAQDKFWDEVRSRVGSLDLKKDERLCAIAFVKRMYPRLSDELFGWKIDVDNWPSTAYLAAAPWVGRVAHREEAEKYAKHVLSVHPGARGEWGTNLKCIEDNGADFPSLDGNFFLDEALANENATSLGDATEKEREALSEELAELYNSVDEEPSRYYALLLMDGDKMGAILQGANKQGNTSDVSQALGRFSQSVDEIVSDHDGIAVYAGGDDVMALMTLPRVLECALALRDEYLERFSGVDTSQPATASAGVVYAHYKTPLAQVLSEAHRLLDDVAKDQTGRDSIAISVLKPSGKQVEWTAPFEYFRRDQSTHRLDILAGHLASGPDGKGFTNSFFYGLRRSLMTLADKPRWKPGTHVEVPEELELAELVTSQYLQTDPKLDRDEARIHVEALLDVGHKVTRDVVGQDDRLSIEENTLGFDASLLVKFLTTELGDNDQMLKGQP